jgi:hypothetical protein
MHAALPESMAELIILLAATLEAHVPAVDPGDDAGQLELRAYTSLAAQYRTIAQQLGTAAAEMRSYQDLPMAQHHDEVLLRAETFQPFRAYVDAERRQLELLRTELQRDEQFVDAVDRMST